MVGKAVARTSYDDVTSSSVSSPLAPPTIYDAYPLTSRSLAPSPSLERALSSQQPHFTPMRADDDELHPTDDMSARQQPARRSATMFSRFGKFTGEVYETKERSRMISVLKRRSHTPAADAHASGVAAATASSKFTADDVLRAGMLTKQGSWRRNWKTRFFILRSDYPSLSYYKSEDKLELLGCIPITDDTLVLDKSAPGGHAPFRFQLRTDAANASLLLETETHDNQQRWIDACRELVDALRAEKFRQSTLSVDRDPTTARQAKREDQRARPSMGSTLRASASSNSNSGLLSASAPAGSQLQRASTSGRIRGTNAGSSRDLRRTGGLTGLDASSDEDEDTPRADELDTELDDDLDDDIWATSRNNFLVVLDESTRDQNIRIQETQRSHRASMASIAASRPPDIQTIRNPNPAFDLVLELALGRQSKLLSRSDDDKLRCSVKIVAYIDATKSSIDLGLTDAVRIAASASTNPDGTASPVRVAFSSVVPADLDRYDQLRFTVYRTTTKSNRAIVGVGRCFVDDAFKTLGAPRLVALAEKKESSLNDLLGASRIGGSSSNTPSMQPLDSNAVHLVVQAFPSLAPQSVLPTSGIDMAAAKYLLPSTLPTDDMVFVDNGSFLSSEASSARHIVVDEILRAPRATFAMPLAFLEYLEATALERTLVLQKLMAADAESDHDSDALLAFELEFYRKKLEEYLRQRQFLMKQEKRLLDEAQAHQIFQYAAEQVLALSHKQSSKTTTETPSDATPAVELVAPFKRSTYKSIDLWQFVPTNMQDQFLCAYQPPHVNDTVTQPFVWHTMTMGCPAAHTKGFGTGGFPLTASVLDAARPSVHDDMDGDHDHLFSSSSSSPFDPPITRGRSRTSTTHRTSHSSSSNPANEGLYQNDSVSALKVRLELKDRLDVVASQALAAAISCITASLDLAVAGSEMHARQLATAAMCGYLVHFESLLSTQGKEIGMLEDFAAAAKWLRHVYVQFRRHPASSRPYFAVKPYTPPDRRSVDRTTSPSSVLVIMGVSDAQFAVLPPILTTTDAAIRVRCVLFTQGVNEKQSLAHALKSQTVKVQDRINRENIEELKEIYADFRRAHGGDTPANRRTDPLSISKYSLETLDDMLSRLEQHVVESASQFKKHVAVLTETSDFCRELGGARVTCCKSGKDRTAMSVTLEQTRLCVSRLKVASTFAKTLCATMRHNGVRRKNVFLNTKSTKFAFNEMQRKMLPDCYKPPSGTYKSGTT